MPTELDTAAASGLTTLAKDINECHRAAEAAAGRALHHARAAGDLLLEAKKQCPHGDWGNWLKTNFEGSERSAQNYMRLAKNWGELENRNAVADLSLRDAVRFLTEPKPAKKNDSSRPGEAKQIKHLDRETVANPPKVKPAPVPEPEPKPRAAEPEDKPAGPVCPLCGCPEVDEDGDCVSCHDPWARTDPLEPAESPDKNAKPKEATPDPDLQAIKNHLRRLLERKGPDMARIMFENAAAAVFDAQA